MKQLSLVFLLFLSLAGCSQSPAPAVKNTTAKQVGGRCEGCEAIYESKRSFESLNETDTLPIFNEAGPKLIISGAVYKNDGKTPAPGVVIYVYHTDQSGKYRVIGNETGWGKRHGSIRGWMKTNALGQYKFFTIRPASYSQTGPPAHIHTIVKEPDKNEYWIDDFHFEDDPFLTSEMRKNQQGRGGDGIVKLRKAGDIFYGERDIILGKNVTDYPK